MFTDDTEYRWASLPRVSATKAKRPDHVIQINIDGANKFLVIESKNHAKDLEKKVGKQLTKYVDALFKITPTAYSEDKFDWKLYGGKKSPIPNPDSISGGAFVYKSLDEMKSAMKRVGLILFLLVNLTVVASQPLDMFCYQTKANSWELFWKVLVLKPTVGLKFKYTDS